MFVLILLLMLLVPAMAQAAYPNEATILRYEQDPNGSARFIMRFQGGGEPIVDRAYPVNGSATIQALRNWIKITVDELNLIRTAGTAPAVAPGTVLTGLNPTPPAAIAESVWHDKVRMYRDSCTHGFVGAAATACSALKSDIEATYAAGYLDVD